MSNFPIISYVHIYKYDLGYLYFGNIYFFQFFFQNYLWHFLEQGKRFHPRLELLWSKLWWSFEGISSYFKINEKSNKKWKILQLFFFKLKKVICFFFFRCSSSGWYRNSGLQSAKNGLLKGTLRPLPRGRDVRNLKTLSKRRPPLETFTRPSESGKVSEVSEIKESELDTAIFQILNCLISPQKNKNWHHKIGQKKRIGEF